MKYAFFDLDGTLIPVDSSILWAQTLLNHAGEEKEALTQTRLQFDRDYREGKLDIRRFEDFEMALLARFPRKELDRLRDEYIKNLIAPHILPNAVNLLNSFKRSGVKVIMVTASYRYAVEPIGALFGVDAVLAAEPEENADGEFTGRWISENFAQSKIRGVNALLKTWGETPDVLKDCCFYSDSKNDLPLLEFIADHGGKAIATNPDDDLRAVATARNWAILELFPASD